MLIPQHAQARRPQHQVPSASQWHPCPSPRENSQKMPAREHQYVPAHRPQFRRHPFRAHRDRIRTLSSRTTIAKQIPSRPFLQNLRGPPPFILSVIPLHKVRIHLRPARKSRQFAGPPRPLQRTRQHRRDLQFSQPRAQHFRIPFPVRRQRQIRPPGMLPAQAPCRLPMPRQINRLQLVHGSAGFQPAFSPATLLHKLLWHFTTRQGASIAGF